MLDQRRSELELSVSNALIRRLNAADCLIDSDSTTLEHLCGVVRCAAAREEISLEGDNPENVHVVLDGFAASYKLFPDGRRQILSLLVPADFCDLHGATLGELDHSVLALTSCNIAVLPCSSVRTLIWNHPRIAQAVCWAQMVDAAVSREWLANNGRREAIRRMAHLFCEVFLRLKAVGLTRENSFSFPLTQSELADALALTNVHVNRNLQELRRKGLIILKSRRLTIPDFDRLTQFCAFDPKYLFLPVRLSVTIIPFAQSA